MDLVKLAIGFMLTTLCGGLLGYLFQRRHAEYQWVRSRWEKELDGAQSIFDEVSRLLDRRLYRTRRLVGGLEDGRDLDAKLQDYRLVLFDWNDNINRILAMLTIYFGQDARDVMDNKVGDQFVTINRSIEQHLKNKHPVDAKALQNRLENLRKGVYQFNLQLLRSIEDRRNSIKR